MSQIYQIAIDGPAGSGKSTLAKGVAKKLGIMYLDTGAMYRTCAVAAIKAGVDPKDNNSVSKLIESMKLEVKFIDGVQHMILNGEDVTAILRTSDVSKAASDISALPVVRTSMVNMQRNIAKSETFVLDGRDIGSNVLPDAKYKFFVTASAEVRAQRRLLEDKEKGNSIQTFEEVLADIKYRDLQDSTREFAPLIKTEDAILIDTSNITIEQTLEALLSEVNE